MIFKLYDPETIHFTLLDHDARVTNTQQQIVPIEEKGMECLFLFVRFPPYYSAFHSSLHSANKIQLYEMDPL